MSDPQENKRRIPAKERPLPDLEIGQNDLMVPGDFDNFYTLEGQTSPGGVMHGTLRNNNTGARVEVPWDKLLEHNR